MKEVLKTNITALDLSKKIYVAYSGGVDSHVLLHALSELRSEFPHLDLNAIHIHHGMQKEADAWDEHCKAICRALNVPYVSKKVLVEIKGGDSPEAEARKARYKAFESLIGDHYLLLAQHLEDQTETCLLQLCRGSGIKGLAAMPMQKKLGKGQMLRPLLSVSKSSILDYAKQHDLKNIEDPSNQDEKYSRNFLRKRVLPLLREHYPSLDTSITRTTRHASEANALLNQLAEQDLKMVIDRTEEALSTEKLITLDEARIRNVLRFWIHREGFILPSSNILVRILKDILFSKKDAKPVVEWGNAKIIRAGNTISLLNRE
jgi:tRNA(Ile)-lysidine synthase